MKHWKIYKNRNAIDKLVYKNYEVRLDILKCLDVYADIVIKEFTLIRYERGE